MTKRERYEGNKRRISELYEVLFKSDCLESIDNISTMISNLLDEQCKIVEEYKNELNIKLNQN